MFSKNFIIALLLAVLCMFSNAQDVPTVAPTAMPMAPTLAPTPAPEEPTAEPTPAPEEPTAEPTPAPEEPTAAPTATPTENTIPTVIDASAQQSPAFAMMMASAVAAGILA